MVTFIDNIALVTISKLGQRILSLDNWHAITLLCFHFSNTVVYILLKFIQSTNKTILIGTDFLAKHLHTFMLAISSGSEQM